MLYSWCCLVGVVYTRNPSLQILFTCPTLAVVFGHAMYTKPSSFLLAFGRVENPLRLPHKTTLQRPNVARTCGVLHILTSKDASRHNGVHFLNISTSKSALNVVCSVHFWLRNVLRAATVCPFSTSQLPKVLQAWCVLYILTSKCASRHNGVHFFNISTSKSVPRLTWFCAFWVRHVLRATTAYSFSTSQHISTSKSAPGMVCFVHFRFQMCFAPQRRAISQFFICHPARWLRARRFSEPSFSTLWSHKSLEKRSESRLSTFSRTCIFFLLTLSSDSFSSLIFSDLLSSFLFSSLLWLFPPLLFHLSILLEVWLLNLFDDSLSLLFLLLLLTLCNVKPTALELDLSFVCLPYVITFIWCWCLPGGTWQYKCKTALKQCIFPNCWDPWDGHCASESWPHREALCCVLYGWLLQNAPLTCLLATTGCYRHFAPMALHSSNI